MKYLAGTFIGMLIACALNYVIASDTFPRYTVQSGDTACGIAEKHGIPCSTLIDKNDLDSNALIYPGQELELPDAKVWNGSMPCQIRILSWVDVLVQGDHVAEKKPDFEKLVRLILRRDATFLAHEVKEYGAFWSEVSYDELNGVFLDIDVSKDQRFIRRAEVNCRALSSGSEGPIAVYISCELSGWGDYNPSTYETFRLEALRAVDRTNVSSESEIMLKGLLSDLSGRLNQYREKNCPATPKE